MMRKKYLTLAIGFLIIIGFFTFGAKFQKNEYVPPDYIVMADEITKDVMDTMTKRYNMRVIGVTGGMMGGVNVVGLHFQVQGPLPKEQLRKIVVDYAEEFLTLLNANEKLRPFLRPYPFTVEGIKGNIFVVDGTGNKVYDPNIMLASLYEGRIDYRTVEKNVKFGYKSSEEEDYETALKIVRGISSKIDSAWP